MIIFSKSYLNYYFFKVIYKGFYKNFKCKSVNVAYNSTKRLKINSENDDVRK